MGKTHVSIAVHLIVSLSLSLVSLSCYLSPLSSISLFLLLSLSLSLSLSPAISLPSLLSLYFSFSLSLSLLLMILLLSSFFLSAPPLSSLSLSLLYICMTNHIFPHRHSYNTPTHTQCVHKHTHTLLLSPTCHPLMKLNRAAGIDPNTHSQLSDLSRYTQTVVHLYTHHS